ncbi:MAG: DNA repair protein RecN [Clostridia bacterium]|nr:DNA repair protein RecN [Clostridia bacterium]
MLASLHVKNLALIDEAEIEFEKGLNILSGETGAGKSIIIDSLHLALGGKIAKDIVREESQYALSELVFIPKDASHFELLDELDIPVEEEIILQRKIMNGRSVCKINGETVQASKLQQVGMKLIDIHGQHEHQTLLQKKKHREILDAFCADQMVMLKEELKTAYYAHQTIKKELDEAQLLANGREKEIELISFEIEEIEQADLTEQEDLLLEQRYQKMKNSKKIMEVMQYVHTNTGYEQGEGAGEAVGRAVREMRSVVDYDDELQSLQEQLYEIEGMLNDFNRSVNSYMDDAQFEAGEFAQIEERLNLINHLKDKYGDSVADIHQYMEEQKAKLEKLLNYHEYVEQLSVDEKHAFEKLVSACEKVSALRNEQAKILEQRLIDALMELNFLEANFVIEIKKDESQIHVHGFDEIEFLISTNPGETPKPLEHVASGGELSRIMLAVKTVLADNDETETLIFDEIDTGISGRTAQKVSEKLALLSTGHQVICVTHLPQIASMADAHFEIQKEVIDSHTHTRVKKLSDEEMKYELARMLGGVEITDTVLNNAQEMKKMADQTKRLQHEMLS